MNPDKKTSTRKSLSRERMRTTGEKTEKDTHGTAPRRLHPHTGGRGLTRARNVPVSPWHVGPKECHAPRGGRLDANGRTRLSASVPCACGRRRRTGLLCLLAGSARIVTLQRRPVRGLGAQLPIPMFRSLMRLACCDLRGRDMGSNHHHTLLLFNDFG